MDQRRYRAFISYCHRDHAVAVKLHHALETYAIPTKLVGKITSAGEVPKRLVPIFKDREELPAADSLGEAVDAALAASDALIVICSPASAKSEWVNKEVERFKQIHGGGRVFPALIAGEPNEAFPPALRVHYENGRPTGEVAEPIAADLRPNADGQKLATLKLVAGLTGLELDQLVQRDNQRRQRRLAIVAAASLAGMAGTSGLAAYAIQQRDEARDQRAEADGLIEYMLTDLRGKLEPVGKLDVLDGVGRKALDYYARQKLDQLSADELGRRAKAMLLVAEVGDLRGDNAAAKRGFEQAARSTAELLQRDPDNWQRIYDHAQSEFWLAYEANNRGDNKAALPHFMAYRDLGQRMLAIDPDKLESKVEAASAEHNLGVALAEERRLDEAIALFGQAAARFAAIRPMTRDIAIEVVNSYGYRGSTLTRLGRDRESIDDRLRQLELLKQPIFKPDDREAKERIGIVQSQLAASYLALGDIRAAQTHANQSLTMWDDVRAGDRENQHKWGEENFARAIAGLSAFGSNKALAKTLLGDAMASQRALVAASVDQTHATNLLRMAIFAAAADLGWGGWQRGLTARFYNSRSKLNDAEQSVLAAALIADGDALVGTDRASASTRWQTAKTLLGAKPKSTFDKINLERIERRLSMNSVPRIRHGADKRFAGLLV